MRAAADVRRALRGHQHARVRALADDQTLVRALAQAIALYSPGGQWYQLRVLATGGRAVPVAAAKRKAARLARAVGVVEQLVLDPQIAALLCRGPLGPVRRLVELPVVLAALRAEADAIATLPGGRRRGRPRDRWRDLFCSAIASALANAGHRPTKGRDGLFAAVLMVGFTLAREAPPEDVFDLMKRAADSLPQVP